MTQLVFGSIDAGQLLFCKKAPVAVMEAIFSAALPVFVSVTFCAALVVPTTCELKFKPLGLREAIGCGMIPFPLRLTLAAVVVVPSLPDMLKAPVRNPACVGLKNTL